ncbi:MAG: M15 family metallopeptidase [Bacteroidota bacterium]
MSRAEPHIATLMQHGLMERGFPLPRFGADGDWGAESQAAYDAYVASVESTAPVSQWPTDDVQALNAFYGRPDIARGRAPRSKVMRLPYPMEIAWMPSVWTTQRWAHEAIHESLQAVLERILDVFGRDGIREHGLDQLGGITNVRHMRGSRTKISRHSWGIAIDLDPKRNGLRTPWPSEAKMPVEAIECFEAEGWTSFARVRGTDAMHFQATSNYIGN